MIDIEDMLGLVWVEAYVDIAYGGEVSAPESGKMDSHFMTKCCFRGVNFEGRVFEEIV